MKDSIPATKQPATETITVTLLLFAAYREIAGTKQLSFTVPKDTTVGELFDLLQEQYPGLRGLRSATTFAVNREVQPANTPLVEGDEIAFLQPVSGGQR